MGMIVPILALTLMGLDPSTEPRFELPSNPFASEDAETVDVVFARFLAIVKRDEHTSTAWAEQSVVARKLVAFGVPASRCLSREAEDSEEAKVRTACYYWLTHAFPTDPRVQATIVRCGLNDPDDGIRYVSAFHLGEHKVHGAFRELKAVLAKAPRDEYVGLAAAKSLAQLGEADVLPRLYQARGSDRYMSRHMANIGLKGLTGKNLNDFDYNYGEGAFVSGGNEFFMMHVDPIADAETRAGRYRALAAWCKWLKAKHPEYFKHLEHRF